MGNNKYKILVIEDEANILSFVGTILETNGYQVITAKTCGEGEMMFSSYRPDLVILDLGLPDKDGQSFIKYAREITAVPIIILSARAEEKDKVTALDSGANDYITKPFGTEELLARVRAALRSTRFSERGAVPGGKYILDGLVIDYDKRMVTVNGEDVKLTQTEYNITAFLSEQSGKVLTYQSIIKAIWGHTDSGSIKKLQVNMANIRRKLGEKPGESKYIINELGVGYRMMEESE
ncbi:MAG: response regulator transcription factor [Oscillospiraceae bacterium]|nr:response regulator transcription factor [Oscillospiraceae bacterium]